jgi:predicted dehydrogenase
LIIFDKDILIRMIRVGVIGVGSMGKNHARVYSELKDVTLVGVADKDEKTGSEVAKRLGVEFFSDYKKLLEKVDAVSLVVPTKLHYALAKEILLSGKDVLVEKPMTATLQEADDLIRIAESKKRVLQVGHIERFNPALIQARDYVKPNEVIQLEAHRIGPSGARITDAGVVLDLMIHDIDVILSLVDSPVDSVAALGKKVGGAHEDFAEAIIKFKNGALASIVASRCTQKRERTLKITQKDSYIVVDFMNKSLEIHKQAKSEYVTQDSQSRLVYSDIVEKPQIRQDETLKLELQSFVDSLKDKKTPVVDGRAGKQALEVATQILERIN